MTERGTAIRSRYPLGVLVVATISALRCITILAGLANIEGSSFLDWLRDSSPMPDFEHGSDLELLAAALLAGLLVASVLVVFGLLARRQWAWVLAIVSSGVILAVDLGWWSAGEPRYTSMLLNVIAVFYLNQRDVQLALRGR
jgi:hypothetical protein